jgi:hypothetical protein
MRKFIKLLGSFLAVALLVGLWWYAQEPEIKAPPVPSAEEVAAQNQPPPPPADDGSDKTTAIKGALDAIPFTDIQKDFVNIDADINNL